APELEIVGNKMYYPIGGSEKRAEREAYTLVLRPEAKPPEIDLTSPSGGPTIRGIYRFAAETEPRAGNLWIAVKGGGPRPESFDGPNRANEVLELTPLAPDKPAASRVVDGVDLTPAERRRGLVYQELQLFLAEMQRRKPAESVQQFGDQLERDRNRLDQMRQL